MILVDTSVWVDHLRDNDARLAELLGAGMVLAHPSVIGELALGNLKQRRILVQALQRLPCAIVATDQETLHLIERETLFGMGVGYVDAQLLAAARLTPGSTLWTRDRRLQSVARRMSLAMPLAN